jgi:hypothetical protein
MLGSAITLDLRSQPGDAIVSCRACSQRLVVPAKAYDANAERVLTFIVSRIATAVTPRMWT